MINNYNENDCYTQNNFYPGNFPPNRFNNSFCYDNELEIRRKHQQNMELLKLEHQRKLEQLYKKRNEALYQNQRDYEYQMNRIKKSKRNPVSKP